MTNKFLKYDIHFDTLVENSTYGKFTIKPLEKGFGNTLGNSLRRVLLGNILGASMFAIKIPDVSHEFQSINGIKEDVTQIILNLKKVIIKFNEDITSETTLESQKLENWPTLKIIKKSGKIFASDISCPPEFSIVNKDAYICEVDSKKEFSMEIYATIGRGFKNFQENKELINSIGIIATDSNFSPVIHVSYNIEEFKTSKISTNDALTIEISTNGSINPKDSLALAAKILVDHYQPLIKINEAYMKIKVMNDEEIKNVNSSFLSIPIEELDLSVRSYNCLKRQGIQTIHQIIEMKKIEIEKIRNLGKKSFKEIVSKIEERNLKFKDER